MSQPILFLVDEDAGTLEWLKAVLERRFGADYRILTEPSRAFALTRIEQACESGEKIALVATRRVSAAVADGAIAVRSVWDYLNPD
jgi:hypothetical protein